MRLFKRFKKRKGTLALGLIVLFSVFGLLGCGRQSVTPSAFDPREFYDHSQDPIPYLNTPYDEVSQTEHLAGFSMYSLMTSDDIMMFSDYAYLLIWGAFGERDPFGLLGTTAQVTYTPESYSDLVPCSIVFSSDTLKFVTGDQVYMDEEISFIYEPGWDYFILNGIPYDFQEIGLVVVANAINTYEYALSDTEIDMIHANAVAEQYLVASYDFESEEAGIVEDSIGGNSGTLQGNAAIAAGDQNNTLYLDGDNSYVRVGDDSLLDLSDELTLSVWINPHEIKPSATILSKGYGGFLNYQLGLKRDALEFVYFDGDRYRTALIRSNEYSIDSDSWVHIAVTVSSSAIAFYVDGVKVDEQDGPITLLANDGDMFIGKSDPSSSSFFKGQIDEVKIFSKALSDQEITNLYDSYFQ